MPALYKYKAVTPDGQHRTGAITAQDNSSVEAFLHDQGLPPLQIKLVSERRQFSLFGFMGGSEYEGLIMFTGSLATLHRAGVPLLKALSIIRVGPENGRFNHAIDKLRIDVQNGNSLSGAMSRISDIFSNVYVSCVAAGEESGQLDRTLDEVADILEQELNLNRRIKAGIRYPAMVIGAIVVAFFVLMNFVIPRFVTFYSGFNAELPLPTRIIMGVSSFVTGYWPLLLVLTIVAAFIFRQVLKSDKGRLWFDRLLLRIPVLGTLITKGNVARFSMMFKILNSSGLTIIKSIEVLAATIKNAAIAAEIRQLGQLFRRGREIDLVEGEFKHIPVQALHMLAIGLESGKLDTMLHEIGKHYSKQVMYTSRQLTAIIEPILTLVMGAFVLILALAIFLPMWNLIKVFQG